MSRLVAIRGQRDLFDRVERRHALPLTVGVLVLEVRGMPLDVIAFFGAGWQIHAENLAAYLAGREPDDVEARWEELVPPYQDLAANIS